VRNQTTRGQYKNRIQELEEALEKKTDELKTMMTLWSQVVRQPKEKSNHVKTFGGMKEFK